MPVAIGNSNSLLFPASKCLSLLVRAVFRDSATVCYSSSGYNKLFGASYLKSNDSQYQLCANVIKELYAATTFWMQL